MSCWEVKIQGQLHTMDVLSMESAKPLQPSPGSFFFFFFFVIAINSGGAQSLAVS